MMQGKCNESGNYSFVTQICIATLLYSMTLKAGTAEGSVKKAGKSIQSEAKLFRVEG